MADDRSYDDGRRDEQLKALRASVDRLKLRLDTIEERQRSFAGWMNRMVGYTVAAGAVVSVVVQVGLKLWSH